MRAYKQKKILHITTHLGGGVGRVLLNYFTKEQSSCYFTHEVVCLGYANENALSVTKNIKLKLFDKMAGKRRQLLALIAEADLVLIHWWNHPLLYDFLTRAELPASRVILWSHVSGFYPPHVFTKKIIQYPDIFVVTTPVSFETKEVKNLTEKRKKFLRVVWSTGDVQYVKSVKPKTHDGFIVGYIGTVDYAKLHPHFLQMCDGINIPNVKFVVCGGSDENKIRKEAEDLGIAEKFIFTGLVSDITKYLSIFNVFGYPLSPYHYGTCDQVLAESMAAGVVPVVLPNRMEQYIVKDGLTGIVAKNEDDYARAIERLFVDVNLKNTLSGAAREYAVKHFSLDNMSREWNDIFHEALAMPKIPHRWIGIADNDKLSAKDVFLEALGDHGIEFANYCNAKSEYEKKRAMEEIIKLNQITIWRSKTQGTAHSYFSYFPNDEYLGFWSKSMRVAESAE